LKNFLKANIEKKCNEKLREIRDDPNRNSSSISITEVKIADIVFAYNNSELIKLLRTRGGHIVS
jgi:hypothetical protein